MKNLQLIFAISLFFTLSSNVLQAQAKPSLTEEQKSELVAHLKADKERLQLTAAQEKSFKEITKKYASLLKELKDSDGNRKEKFQKLKEIQVLKSEEMKTVLSEKQFATYLEIQSERKAKMRESRKQ